MFRAGATIVGLLFLSPALTPPLYAQDVKKHPKYLAVVTREGGFPGRQKLRLHDFSGGRILWTYDFTDHAGGVRWPPEIRDGQVVLAGRSLGVLALDLKSGALRWMARKKGLLNWFPGKTVHVAGYEDRTTVGIEAATGKVVWKVDSGAPHGGQVRSGGRVFYVADDPLVPTEERLLHALDVETGNIVWRVRAGVPSGVIVVHDGAVIPSAISVDDVVAYEAKTGDVRWRADAFGEKGTRPRISGGKLYLSASRSELRAVDPRTGRTKWAFRKGGWIQHSSDDALIVSDLRGGLSCLRAETGEVIWKKPRNLGLLGLSVGDEAFMLVVRRSLDRPPEVVGVDPKTWTDLWAIPSPDYRVHPQILGKDVYLAVQTNKTFGTLVRRFDTESGKRAWEARFKEEGFHRIEVVEDWLIVTMRSQMACIKRDTGKIVWNVSCDPVPDSRVYRVYYQREY